MNTPSDSKILRVLRGETIFPPPIWLMRQAGRYLPEYRETRREAGSFLDLCYNPELATEVTMQPIRRFDFDAAILFSDILVIPDALDRDVRFVEGEGPKLRPLEPEEIGRLDPSRAADHLQPVMETVARLRAKLPPEKALIGFCGAPWTVATYMIAGHGTSDQAPARLFAHRHREEFLKLLDLLAEMSADYLLAQMAAGADLVQIFDSWSGVLGPEDFEDFCVKPVAKIVALIRKEIPDAKIIGFPKGATAMLRSYRKKTSIDALGLDWTVPLDLAQSLQKDGAVQGNLDPTLLAAGGAPLDKGIDTILQSLGQGPLIFNLGHGITPQVPPAHVQQLIDRVRGA